jgi:hypothetical protein
MEDSKRLIGEKCEFRTYHEITKKGTQIREKVSEPFGIQDVDDDGHYALVINRIFDDKNRLGSVNLRINSQHILSAFREVIKSYAPVPSDFTSPFELGGPFEMLLHFWDELDAYRCSIQHAEQRMHLNLLFDFMKHEIGPARAQLLDMIKTNQITFKKAWCLFRPGDLIYTQFMGEPWLLRCQYTSYGEDKAGGPYFQVNCTYTGYDGILVGQAQYHYKLYQKRNFGTENPAYITNLPIYPRKFVQGINSLENRLQDRGKRFLAIRDSSVKAYDGIARHLYEPPYTFYHPDMAEFEGVWLPYTESGRIVIDLKTFKTDQYSNAVRIQIGDTDPTLCPPYTFGYSLQRKEWCQFLVDRIHEVQWNENAWNSLILDDQEKSILQALVTSHAYSKNPRDQSQQKGKGLVVLLHGTPGSGKTLTAETVSESTQKPLISVTLAEMNKHDK